MAPMGERMSFGYLLTNVGLHLLGALLDLAPVGQARRPVLRLAWAGLLFVVHPLAVESVAWISES